MTTLDVYKNWLGIPEGPRPPGHYELLRLVRFEDDAEKIRSNYKKLNAHVRKYASGQYSVRSQELLNELAKAMLCLTDPERKREYDESLGRIFEEPAGLAGGRTLGRILADKRVINRDQMKEIENFAEARGLSIRDAVVQMKLTDPTTAAQALAEEIGRPFLDLSDVVPDDSVLDRVPRSTVKRFAALPLFIDDDNILVACIDDPPQDLVDELRLRFELPVRVVLSTPLAINQGIAKYYAPGVRDEAIEDTYVAGQGRQPTRKGGKRRGKAKAHHRFAELSPEAQRERTQIGYIIMCWAVVGSVMVDQLVLKGRLIPWKAGHFLLGSFPFDQLFLSLFVPPLAIWWTYKVYWK